MTEPKDNSHALFAASDELKDIYCDPCSKQGHQYLAEGYCTHCLEYLCGQCYRWHHRHRLFETHVLLDKDSMPTTPASDKRVLDICVTKCSDHPNKVIEFFCETCCKLGCNICITLRHRQCEEVKYIPDIVKDLENSEEFSEFNEDIESAAYKLSEQEKVIETNDTYNNEMSALALQEIKRQRAEINKFFDNLEKQIEDQVLDIQKRNIDTLKAATDRLNAVRKDIKLLENDIEAKKNGQKCELFIAMKEGQQKMMTFKDQLMKLSSERRIQRYTLLPSEQIQDMMRTTTEICRMATARLESQIIITTITDEEQSMISAITILHGHYCLAGDYKNKCIKVIDTRSMCVVSEISIEAEGICGITEVGSDQVAVSVSFPDDCYQLQFFSVSASGDIQSTQEKYDVENWYWDLVHCNGNLYAPKANEVHILDMIGNIIQRFTGNDQWINLSGIAISPDRETLYVADYDNNSITSMTLDGNVKVTYKDDKLNLNYCITVDNNGYVYVPNTETDSILQLTADLIKVQVLIEDVPTYSITFSSTENKLYCGQGNLISQVTLGD